MKTYTEEEVKQAIKYACSYQKASDYQTAGQYLLADDYPTTDPDIKLLDELAESDTNSHLEIEISDVFPETKRLVWLRSTKQMPDVWIASTDEEYERGQHLERFNWKQVEK